MSKHIICITPIKHMDGIYEFLQKKGRVSYLPKISKNDLIKKLKIDHSINHIFCNPNMQNFILDEEILSNSNIKIINTASTGTNHIDLNACKRLKINVFSLKNDKKLINKLPSTSELAFCLMIGLLKNLLPSFDSVKKKKWSYLGYIGQELASLKVGIIGYGRLGKFMSKFCKAFGMEVCIYDKYVKSKKFKNLTLKNIFKSCDIISLHIHLNSQTEKIINTQLIKLSKKKPIIINTSRGNIVDEKAILYALKNKIISGYGTDVLCDELDDIKKSEIIRNIKNYNILVTPHIGGMTYQGQKRAYKWAIEKF